MCWFIVFAINSTNKILRKNTKRFNVTLFLFYIAFKKIKIMFFLRFKVFELAHKHFTIISRKFVCHLFDGFCRISLNWYKDTTYFTNMHLYNTMETCPKLGHHALISFFLNYGLNADVVGMLRKAEAIYFSRAKIKILT